MRKSLQAVADRAEAWSNWLDRRPLVILLLLAPVYAWLLQRPSQNGLWFDELHTYYIAQAPSFGAMMDDIRHVDLNPPLIYFLVRVSYALFGVSVIATRLPSILPFFLACAAVSVFLARRIGGLWACAAIALLWFSPFFQYATEARPYGLLLSFFTLALMSWDRAVSEDSAPSTRKWALAGVFAGSLGMMLSHALAPLSIMPFCVAELVRSYRRRRLDWALWAALLSPLTAWVLAFTFIKQVVAATYPPGFRASPQKMVAFYTQAIELVLPALLVALVVAFPIAAKLRGASVRPRSASLLDLPLFISALAAPVLLNLALMRTHGPFWDRYCITTAIILYSGIIFLIAKECRLNRRAGFAALASLLICCGAREAHLRKAEARPITANDLRLDQIRPELPLVVNAATVFLALDYGESDTFLKRVFYLVDRESALRYAHTDIFEGVATLKQYFPIRANVEPYQEFAAANRRFLVFGTPEDSNDWLLRKLMAEGAEVHQLGEYESHYQDALMYEVTLPSQHHAKADGVE